MDSRSSCAGIGCCSGGLNLSPFVLIVSLAFWTVIWGVVGAFLCVPIMVIISIILSKFDGTQWIAILLSGTGKVKKNETPVGR